MLMVSATQARDGEIVVRDGLPVLHVRFVALELDMDPQMVATGFGERADAFLRHDEPVADPELLTDQCLHRLRAFDDPLCYDTLLQT